MLLVTFLMYGVLLSVALAFKGARPPRIGAQSATAVRPARLLIVGATGGTGRQLVAQALDRGYVVTALARNPSAIATVHDRLRVVKGDVLDPSSIEAAMRGQDAVLSSLGHRRFFYPSRIQSAGTQNVLQAMETQGVRRFVCQTSLGLGSSAFRGGVVGTFLLVPAILPFYFWDKARQEQVVARSHVDWILVRPGTLTNGPRRGAYTHGPGAGSYVRGGKISRADVADFMLNQLDDNTYLKSAPGVCW